MYTSHNMKKKKNNVTPYFWRQQCFFTYNGNNNGEKLKKHKISIFGSKIYSNKLIFRTHIEEDHTNVLCFLNKIRWNHRYIDKIDILDVDHNNGALL